jgi:hypothetical protein
MSMTLATADTGVQPAGGAALDQVVIATGGASLAMLALGLLVLAHQAGRTTLLARLGAFAERQSGIPGWASLPAAVAGIALPLALFGMMWDISLHIDNGRDEGPLANPAHYFILAGLYGVFAAGVLGIGMPRGRKPCPSAISVRGFHAPAGALLIAACGGFALIGFPLDDVWHRLFGQDVTLWGPTHLMLIGGAGLTLVGMAILMTEGLRARPADRPAPTRAQSLITTLRRAGLMGGLLIGLSTFQGEFDFGVPQFRLVFHPMLVSLAAGLALVAARLWLGRGGALMAVAFYFVVRGVIALLVGPVLGQSMPAQPLYLVSAVAIEGAAIALGTQRVMRFAVAAGALVGTVGLAAEWAWTQVAFPLPWTADILPEAIVHGVVAGVAGAVIGALLAEGLRGDGLPRRAAPAFAASLAAVAVLTADGLATSDPEGLRAEVARDGDALVVRLDPPQAGEGAAWLTMTSWQGGGLVVDRLEAVGPGTYRTTQAAPLEGTWKTLIRLHEGRTLAGLPVFLPEDRGIPAPELPAPAAGAPVARAFTGEVEILQRERKDAGGGLWLLANLVVLACFLTFFAILAWGVARVARAAPGRGEPPRPEQREDRALVAAGTASSTG